MERCGSCNLLQGTVWTLAYSGVHTVRFGMRD